MEIKFEQEKLIKAQSDLLHLSRKTRQISFELEEVKRELRQLSELDACKAELRKKAEETELITAQLVNMSLVLEEITELYAGVEARNADRIDGEPALNRSSSGGTLRSGDGAMLSMLEEIFHR